jgi:hypothetical protein
MVKSPLSLWAEPVNEQFEDAIGDRDDLRACVENANGTVGDIENDEACFVISPVNELLQLHAVYAQPRRALTLRQRLVLKVVDRRRRANALRNEMKDVSEVARREVVDERR